MKNKHYSSFLKYLPFVLLMTLYAGCSLLVYYVYKNKTLKDDTQYESTN